MSGRYFDLAFTPAVQSVQRRRGGPFAASGLPPRGAGPDALGPRERELIAACDTFFLASVSETGWPYVQHRGGPPGFVRVLGDHAIGWSELAGNSQYVSAGNTLLNDRVALIFVDFARRRRLKLLGHLNSFDLGERPDLAVRLALDDARARVERAAMVRVEGLDWNCPQHITPRFTSTEAAAMAAAAMALPPGETAGGRQPDLRSTA